MKKSLIALAALASVGIASAQSSVTISGRIDLGHANIKTKATDDGESSTSKASTLAGDQHGRTTSRLTFSGTEDLGGGLKASFNYETRLNPDATAAAGLDRTRNMFLNLSGGFGGVTVGTYLNSIDSVRGFSAATYSAPGGDFLANHIGVVGQFLTQDDLVADGVPAATATALLAIASNGLSGRSTNSIGYTSPSFGGVTASFGVSKEKTSTDTTALNKVDGMIGSVAYASGPLNARIAIGQGKASVQTATLGLTSSKTTDTAMAVSYDLGFVAPYIQHESTKLTLGNAGGEALTEGNVLKTKATEIGAKFPMGAFTPYVTMGSGKVKFDGESINTSAFQVGTTYDLSKRTSLYAATGQFSLKNDGAKIKTTGYKAGLVHNF